MKQMTITVQFHEEDESKLKENVTDWYQENPIGMTQLNIKTKEV